MKHKMNKPLFLFLLIVSCFACSKSNIETLDQNIVLTYNKITEDLEDMEELVSSESMTDMKTRESMRNLAKSINTNVIEAHKGLTNLEFSDDIHTYIDTTIALFTNINDIAQFNLKFLQFNEDTPDYLLEDFGMEHDKMRRDLQKQTSNFFALRNEILEEHSDLK